MEFQQNIFKVSLYMEKLRQADAQRLLQDLEVKKQVIQYMSTTVAYEFDLLKRFVDQTTELYDESHQKEILALSIHPSNYGLLNDKSDERIRLQGVIFNSALISSVALFESTLKDICATMVVSGKIEPEEIKARSYIEASRIFLTKVVGIDISQRDEIWKTLFTYAEIRNKIIHEQGRVYILNPKSKHDLIEKIKSMKGVRLDEKVEQVFEIVITDLQFIHTYIDKAKEYLQYLIAEILKQKFST